MNIEDRVIERPSDTCIPFEGNERDLYDGIGLVVARFNDRTMTDLYYLAEVILTQSVTDDAQQATLNAIEFCQEPGEYWTGHASSSGLSNPWPFNPKNETDLARLNKLALEVIESI